MSSGLSQALDPSLIPMAMAMAGSDAASGGGGSGGGGGSRSPLVLEEAAPPSGGPWTAESGSQTKMESLIIEEYFSPEGRTPTPAAGEASTRSSGAE
jgi:hypothetical protein